MNILAVPAVAASSVGVVLATVFSQDIPTGSSDLQTLITQLGVFGVVVVVFKFMLGRQDVRDAESDERDAQGLNTLHAELNHERTARAADREHYLAEIAKEREAHGETRNMLIEHLSNRATESADRAHLVRVQKEIADMVGSLVVSNTTPDK